MGVLGCYSCCKLRRTEKLLRNNSPTFPKYDEKQFSTSKTVNQVQLGWTQSQRQVENLAKWKVTHSVQGNHRLTTDFSAETMPVRKQEDDTWKYILSLNWQGHNCTLYHYTLKWKYTIKFLKYIHIHIGFGFFCLFVLFFRQGLYM
jgi:hypothetical protein